jgi:hypothetical protein
VIRRDIGCHRRSATSDGSKMTLGRIKFQRNIHRLRQVVDGF